MDGNMMNNLNQPKNKGMKWLGLILVLALLFLGCAILFGGKLMNGKLSQKATSEYQAVFLTNGQVYFGKMEFQHGWVVMKDIYYLQVTQNLQNATGGDQNTQTNNTGTSGNQQSIQLVKLGSELHGPEDTMYIAKETVLFWENMKDDSRVLQSIREYKNK